MRGLFLLVLLGAVACATPMPPRRVVRVDGGGDGRRLTSCVPWRDSTLEELREHCGPPDAIVAWSRYEHGRCALYRTDERPRALLAVCADPYESQGATRSPVVDVFVLDLP